MNDAHLRARAPVQAPPTAGPASAAPLASALYAGTLRHARRAPRHAFTYRVTLLYLDLGELPALLAGPGPLRSGRAGLLSFHDRDYLPDRALPGIAGIAEGARDEVAAQLGRRPLGPVRLLTYPRWLGHVFNPVSFFYLFAPGGERLEAVLAEVSNTPWKERHAYAVPAGEGGVSAELPKQFHVSPFQPMEQRYRWTLPEPGERLRVEMRNYQASGPAGEGTEVFSATLALARRPWSAAALWRAGLALPAMSARAVAGIYWQALRLWLKRARFHPHPAAGPAGAP